MDGMPHITTATPMARLARALKEPTSADWTIEGEHGSKLILLRHRDDVAIQIDRGQRKRRACRVYVEIEHLHSGKALGGFRQTAPEAVRTWTEFGYLPMPPRLPAETDALRDALVAAIDRALGPAAERGLEAIRARLALDVAPLRDGRPDPHGIGWFLAADTGEIYGPRQTVEIADGPARQALLRAMRDLCVIQHGKIIFVPTIDIPEIDSAHARAEATAVAAAGGLAEPLTLTLA